jgi:glycosyltransferase involved in cell wall biosynthesis
VGGIPDIIQDGINGLLIPPRNPQAIAEAIVHLYHRPELRRRLAHQAEGLLDEFSPARMVRSYENLYCSLNSQL